MAAAPVGRDQLMEEPSGKDGARARQLSGTLPPGVRCDGEEFRTPRERGLVYSWH